MDSTAVDSPTRPKYRRRLLAIAVGSLLVVGLLVIAGLMIRGEYPTTQTVERSFVIDEDFTKVRKILVRTDAAKQIVTMTGDSEFIDQQWNTIGAGLEGERLLDLKWQLGLEGTLQVRTQDPYIGEQDITLRQTVHIDPDQILSDVTLTKPSQRLLQYAMITHFQRQKDGRTLVRQQLTQEILTDAPWFAHGIADRRVYASAEHALENQETAIRQIVAENRDQRWLLLE
jgi:hypothetical protein